LYTKYIEFFQTCQQKLEYKKINIIDLKIIGNSMSKENGKKTGWFTVFSFLKSDLLSCGQETFFIKFKTIY